MADVTGQISGTNGTQDVTLNNAATEATLKLLLQSSLAANKQSIENIKSLAQKSGLDPVAVAAANDGLRQTEVRASKLGAGMEALGYAAGVATRAFDEAAGLTKKLVAGTAEASDVFASFSKIGGPIGWVAGQMGQLATAQQKYLETYQSLSASGINFGGSLTQMRMAASNAYMTLDGFSKLMKDNSENFAKMGGTANQGAQSFMKVAAEMQQSGVGEQLRNLGYTGDQAVAGLASYIAMTGGRNAQEMKDTKGLASAAGEYMSQLDQLAQITGKSREQQEQALKEESANQAYQSYLMTLDEEGKKKANAAMAEAMAKGGKGAAQALQSQLLGLPPMTKAAQEFTAVAPKMAAANNKMAAAVKDGTKGLEDVRKAGDELGIAANQTKKDMGKTGEALIMGGGSFSGIMGSIFGTANRNEQQGVKTAQDAKAQRDKLAKDAEDRSKSEAKQAAETQKSLQALGNTILSALMPVIQALLPPLNFMIRGFADVVTWLIKTPGVLQTLGIAVGLLTAAFVAYKVIMAGVAVAEKAKAMAGGFREGGVKGALGAITGATGALGSKTNPMYVIIVGNMPGGFDIPGGPEGKGGKGKAGGAKGKMGGLLKSAGSLAKGAGAIGAVMGVVNLASDIGSISDRKKKGEITEEQAKTETGGAVGSAAGGAGGAWGGAALGATIGTMLLPGIGTAVGGALGGVVGGLAGSSVGKNIGEWFAGSGKKESDKVREQAVEKQKAEEAALVKKKAEAEAALKGPGIMQSLMTAGNKAGAIGADLMSSGSKAMPSLGSAAMMAIPGVGALSMLADTLMPKDKDKLPMSKEAMDFKANAGLPPMTNAALEFTAKDPAKQATENLKTEVATLNKTMSEILRYMKDTADNTKRTHDATKSLNGNLWAA